MKQSADNTFVYSTLDAASRESDQWIKHEERAQHGIQLKKAAKSRLKHNARKFMISNDPQMNELNRGHLVYILQNLVTDFNPMNNRIHALNAMHASNSLILLNRLVPIQLLGKIF